MDPVTHQVTAGGNNSEYTAAVKLANFIIITAIATSGGHFRFTHRERPEWLQTTG